MSLTRGFVFFGVFVAYTPTSYQNEFEAELWWEIAEADLHVGASCPTAAPQQVQIGEPAKLRLHSHEGLNTENTHVGVQTL